MKLLTIAITDRCTLRCPYCPLGAWRDRHGDIDADKLSAWAEKHIDNHWVVELTGGEPSIHRSFRFLRIFFAMNPVIIRTNNPAVTPQSNETILLALHGRKIQKPANPQILHLGFFAHEDCEVAERFQGVWPSYATALALDKVPPTAPMPPQSHAFIVPEGFVRRCSASQTNIGSIHDLTMDWSKADSRCNGCAGYNMASWIYNKGV